MGARTLELGSLRRNQNLPLPGSGNKLSRSQGVVPDSFSIPIANSPHQPTAGKAVTILLDSLYIFMVISRVIIGRHPRQPLKSHTPRHSCTLVFNNFRTLPFCVSCKSFTCRFYENCRGGGGILPRMELTTTEISGDEHRTTPPFGGCGRAGGRG